MAARARYPAGTVIGGVKVGGRFRSPTQRGRYPAGTIIDGLKVGGRFMPSIGRGEVDIYLPVRQQRNSTGQFLSEFEGKAQKAALRSAQMGAAAVRSRIQVEFNTRTGALLDSVQAVARGSTSAAIVVGARHALWLNEGSSPHIIRPRDKKALAWPARFQWPASERPYARVQHPGTRGPYNHFVEDAIEDFETEIGEAIVAELSV